MIRTPDQRLRVFISSTLGELAAERKSVTRAISAVGLTPVLFELGARPYPPRELYRAYLAQSDIFIGLYWQRYGWVVPGMDISGLEDEFRLSEALPRLLYVKAPAPDREAGLTAMLDTVRTEGTESYRNFKTPPELGRLVRADLALLLSERFDATSDRAAGDANAESSKSEPKRSLPVPSSSLIGRDKEVTDVIKLADAPENRLITLSGPGGIGKTRLAIAVAERLQDHYPRGATFVSLGSISRRDQAIARIAAAVGANLQGARDALDGLAEYLADGPTLLVLDELDRVADIGADLDELLTRCPALHIIATSRVLLRIRAEHDFPVGPLMVPAFTEPPRVEELAALPAVQLFVDRAKAVSYDFKLTQANALAVAEICRLVDGLPLAIELAAARTRLLEPATLLERLNSSLDALGAGPVDLPARQRTLRATVEWSIGLLDAKQRRMLSILSVFVDGWTLDAAVAVTAQREDPVLDLLDGLASHSLISISIENDAPRFGMLSSIRALAAELLAKQPDAAQIAQRHAEHFRDLAIAGDWPATQQTEWTGRLRAEEGNVAAAIEWHLAHEIGPLPHVFLVLWLHWLLHDQMQQGRAWIERLVARAKEFDDQAQAELMLAWALTAVQVGDDAGALKAMAGIRRLQGEVRDPYIRSAGQLAISWVLPIADDIDGALKAAIAAVDGFRALGDPFLVWATSTVGLFELMMDRVDAARKSLTETRELADRMDNPWIKAFARATLATLAVRAGRLDEARAILDQITAPGEAATVSMEGLAYSLVTYAEMAVQDGEAPQAAAAMAAAESLRERVGLQAWPSVRRSEKELNARIDHAGKPREIEAARRTGSGLSRDQAIALVRGEGLPHAAKGAHKVMVAR